MASLESTPIRDCNPGRIRAHRAGFPFPSDAVYQPGRIFIERVLVVSLIHFGYSLEARARLSAMALREEIADLRAWFSASVATPEYSFAENTRDDALRMVAKECLKQAEFACDWAQGVICADVDLKTPVNRLWYSGLAQAHVNIAYSIQRTIEFSWRRKNAIGTYLLDCGHEVKTTNPMGDAKTQDCPKCDHGRKVWAYISPILDGPDLP